MPSPGPRPEATTNQADLVRVPVADVLAVEELERRRRACRGRRRHVDSRRHDVAPRRRPGPELAARPRARLRHRRRAARLRATAPSCRAGTCAPRLQRRERHRPEQLDREPRDEPGRSGIVAGEHVRHQRARRAAVHRVRAPRTRVSGVGTNCSPWRANRLPCSETTSSDTASSDTGAHRRQRTATPTLTPTGPTLTPAGSLHTVDRRIGESGLREEPRQPGTSRIT